MKTAQQPSAAQIAALVAFAASYGRNWKSSVNQAWMTGNYHGFTAYPYLQQVRNQFGPSWLARFKIPKVAPVRCDRCEMVSIQGVACHETGCQNMGARWDAESEDWIKQRTCFECGCSMDDGSLCCEAPGNGLSVETATAPSSWASYLINGDASGLDDGEEAAADAWIDSLGWGAPTGCEDAGFIAYHDAHQFALASDCQVYSFLVDHS